jgi:hypothetical protein
VAGGGAAADLAAEEGGLGFAMGGGLVLAISAAVVESGEEKILEGSEATGRRMDGFAPDPDPDHTCASAERVGPGNVLGLALLGLVLCCGSPKPPKENLHTLPTPYSIIIQTIHERSIETIIKEQTHKKINLDREA